MVIRLVRRAVSGGVLFFAVLGFMTVPLGGKSGWEHTRAALRSPEGARVIADFSTTIITAETRTLQLLKSWVMRQVPANAPASSAVARRPAPQESQSSQAHASRGAPVLRTPRPPQ